VKTILEQPCSASSVAPSHGRAIIHPSFGGALLALIAIWEFGALIIAAGSKPFWFDELITFHVSRLQPFSALWQALNAGIDSMPPGYYAIVRLANMLPFDPHVTLRLPSIVGYILGLLGVYWFTRKRLPVPAGVFAVVLMALTPFREYALEARSYALLVGLLAISAALWQRVGEGRLMTPLLALFLTLAVCCHPLAVVAISCFGLAEAAWTFTSRRIRWGVWAGCVLAAGPFLFGLPLLLRVRQVYGKNFWSRPSWSEAYLTYDFYLGLSAGIALVLVLVFAIAAGDSLWRTLRRPRELTRRRDFSAPEIILIGSFMFYPALLFSLMKIMGSGYTPRYGWPGIIGLVLGLVYLLRGIWFQSSSLRLVAALLIALAVLRCQEFRLRPKTGLAGTNAAWAGLAQISRDRPGMPVVIGSGLIFLAADESAPSEMRDRFVAVVNTDMAIRSDGTDTIEKNLGILAQFLPLHVDELAPFLADNRKFILQSGGGHDWFTPYLVEKKYQLTLISTDAAGPVYMAEQ
jgi:uncharacterized membrane protein